MDTAKTLQQTLLRLDVYEAVDDTNRPRSAAIFVGQGLRFPFLTGVAKALSFAQIPLDVLWGVGSGALIAPYRGGGVEGVRTAMSIAASITRRRQMFKLTPYWWWPSVTFQYRVAIRPLIEKTLDVREINDPVLITVVSNAGSACVSDIEPHFIDALVAACATDVCRAVPVASIPCRGGGLAETLRWVKNLGVEQLFLVTTSNVKLWRDEQLPGDTIWIRPGKTLPEPMDMVPMLQGLIPSLGYGTALNVLVRHGLFSGPTPEVYYPGPNGAV